MMRFKHSGSLGDIVYALPTIISLINQYDSGKACAVYLQPNVPAAWLPSTVHPAGKCRMNEELALSLIPLLQKQSYVKIAKLHEGEEFDVDLDFFRGTGIDYRGGHIPRWYNYAFLTPPLDLSLAWLTIHRPDKGARGRVVVSRTSRYRNPKLSYRFLNDYQPLFLGLPDEYEDFVKECPDSHHACPTNLLGAANIIAASRLFIGNQSVCYAIAEVAKVKPRILEACLYANNVVPHGEAAWDVVNQSGFEFAVKKTMGC